MTETLTQAAPDSAALVLVPRAQIVQSRLNPRKTFDQGRLEELMESMRAHGFLANFPLLVRPRALAETILDEDAPKYELVCGERRWRASGEVGIDAVWCVVREMEDSTALELALVENLQRSDLSPLEEGDGYKQLLELTDLLGKPLHTVETIAARVGRTGRHISDRVSLCKLRGSSAEAPLESGELPASHARLIARLPTVALRDEVTQAVLKPKYGPGPLSYQQLQTLIREDYMIELRGAPFDPAISVVVTVDDKIHYSGPCSKCQFNTKNAPDEEERGSRQHMCMNPECYRLKVTEAHQDWQSSVEDESAGVKALSLEESNDLWNYSGTALGYSTDYVDLAAKPGHGLLRSDVNPDDAPIWKEIIKDQGVPVILAKDREGNVHELVQRELALTAASLAGCSVLRQAEPRPTPEQEKADREKQARERRKETLLYERTESAIMTAILGSKKLPDAYWDVLFRPVLTSFGYNLALDEMAANFGWEEGEKSAEEFYMELFQAAPLPQKMVHLCQLSLRLMYDSERETATGELIESFAIDRKAIKKQVDQEIAAEEKAAKLKAEIAAGLVWSNERADEADFEWNESNICVDSDACALTFPKGVKVSAAVFVARSKKGWHVSSECTVKGFTNSGYSPDLNTPAYSNRTLALRTGLLEIEEKFNEYSAPAKALERIEAYLAFLGGDSEEEGGKEDGY